MPAVARSIRLSALLICLLGAWRAGAAPAPAPAPGRESLAVLRCSTCDQGSPDAPRSLSLDILVKTDVAQFYTYRAQGSILVYFVARAKFSHPPGQLQLSDFHVENGTVLEILAENACTTFLLRGSVQQRAAWLGNTTEVRITAPENATADCAGTPFPEATANATSANAPIGSMYAPDMAYTAAGPITTAATNFIRLAFSQPITSLDISSLNISLTPAPDAAAAAPSAAAKARLQNTAAALAPAPGPAPPACIPAYQAQLLPAIRNSTQFYNAYITVPDCFYGLVMVHFEGQVTNAAGALSLPIKPVGFNRVAYAIPVQTVTPFEQLPPLGSNLEGTC